MPELTPDEMVENVRAWKERYVEEQKSKGLPPALTLSNALANGFARSMAEAVMAIAEGQCSAQKVASALALAYKILGEEVPGQIWVIANETEKSDFEESIMEKVMNLKGTYRQRFQDLTQDQQDEIARNYNYVIKHHGQPERLIRNDDTIFSNQAEDSCLT